VPDLRLGTEHAEVFTSALGLIEVDSALQVYWVGRLTLVNASDEVQAYDRVVADLFGLDDPPPEILPSKPDGPGGAGFAQSPPSQSVEEAGADSGSRPGSADVLRQKDFATCTDDELGMLAVLRRTLAFPPRPRQTHRHQASHDGPRLDIARTIRVFSDDQDSGEPADLERALSRLRRTCHRVI
jgi:uncharacterized protein with von Willebrand factor type A (vWA) domain